LKVRTPHECQQQQGN
jgi:hypothetical protein